MLQCVFGLGTLNSYSWWERILVKYFRRAKKRFGLRLNMTGRPNATQVVAHWAAIHDFPVPIGNRVNRIPCVACNTRVR